MVAQGNLQADLVFLTMSFLVIKYFIVFFPCTI